MLVSILNMRVWRNVLTVQVRLTHSRAPHPPQHAGIPLKAQGGLSAMPSDPSQALLVGLERYRPHTSPVRWVNPPRPRSADGRLRLREVE